MNGPAIGARLHVRRPARLAVAVVGIAAMLVGCTVAATPSPPPTPTAGPTAGPTATPSRPPTPPMYGPPAPPPSKQPGDIEDATVLTDRPSLIYDGRAPWQIHVSSGGRHVMEAYANAPSYLPGDTLRLAVSTDSKAYAVAVFRVGAEMQPMHRSGLRPGMRQPGAVVDHSTSMVRAPWLYTYFFVIPASWPSGLYFAKVSGRSGAASYVPFVVRSTRPSRLLFVSAFLNAEAYNTWGGSSLYISSVGDPAPGEHRAFAVSFDRPFDREEGMGELFMFEVPLISWLERNHYDVTYTTDYDLSTHPADQPVPRAALFSGHDEYWGTLLRDWLDAHVLAKGDMGLGVFAADTGYWRVRFRDGSATGPRTVVLYKNARRDPNIGRACPGGYNRYAEAFRSLPCGHDGPGNRPEQALYGVQYGDIVPGYHPYYIASTAPASLLIGTGLGLGQSLGDIAGGEVDHVFADIPAPAGVSVLAHDLGLTARDGTPARAQAVAGTVPSGGRVFASGTFWWAWGLEARYAAAHGVPAGFATLTANILSFLAGP